MSSHSYANLFKIITKKQKSKQNPQKCYFKIHRMTHIFEKFCFIIGLWYVIFVLARYQHTNDFCFRFWNFESEISNIWIDYDWNIQIKCIWSDSLRAVHKLRDVRVGVWDLLRFSGKTIQIPKDSQEFLLN